MTASVTTTAATVAPTMTAAGTQTARVPAAMNVAPVATASARAMDGNIVERTSLMFQELTNVVAASDGDCGQLAAGLTAFVEKDKSTLDAIREKKKSGTPEEKKSLD